MSFLAKAVANEFIELAGGRDLSPMKLQKLVYFAHGWYLAITDRALIQENVEAWQFGPVIPELYQEFKRYGSGDVSKPSVERGDGCYYVPRVANLQDDPDADRAMEVIRSVWDHYGKYSAIKLSNATHMAGTPWSHCYSPMNLSAAVIPNEEIADYFRCLLP
jgi:uncharacterized phage-associated protein